MKWIKLQGYREYAETLDLMESKLYAIIGGAEDIIYSLEHQHVYTAGVSASDNELLSNDIPVHKIGRGGKYTYHGPGQLVIYPILNLGKYMKDLHLYVRNLEQIIIKSLVQINIDAFTMKDKVGIWGYAKKIPLPKLQQLVLE